MNIFNQNFNKKIIMFFSISTLAINGCAVKNEFKTNSASRAVVTSKPIKNFKTLKRVKPKVIWGKKLALTTKKEDCVDCYATPIAYSKPLALATNSYKTDKVIDTQYYGAYDYTETGTDRRVKINTYAKVSPPKIVNSSYGSYSISSDTAIQVGAFRKYSGAKVYMKRYNALSDKYRVSIKRGRKNNKPIHRVRIEGFQNKIEAKRFMYSYGIKDAVLVRK